MRSASDYDDDELIDVFWSVNRDKFPGRYSEICKELDNRKISYEDLPQWQRNQIKLEEELDSMGEAKNLLIPVYRLIIVGVTALGLIYGYFKS
jgi:hypothetical protein